MNVLRMEHDRPKGMCLRCGLCARQCPAGARIEVRNGLKAFGLDESEEPKKVSVET